MAITTCLTNQFKLDLLKGGLRFDTTKDTFKVALYVTAATLLETTAAYTATNEVIGTGYSAGGATVVPTISPAGTTTYIDFSDAQWTSATFTDVRGMMLYRSGADAVSQGTLTNCAIGIWDFGSPKAVSAGTFTIVMPAADTSNALIRLS